MTKANGPDTAFRKDVGWVSLVVKRANRGFEADTVDLNREHLRPEPYRR
jgi:hypothetical protein